MDFSVFKSLLDGNFIANNYMKSFLIICFLVITFCSCSNSSRKNELNSLLYTKEQHLNNKRRNENDLNYSNDNNEIDAYNSAMIGHPVTKGQLRQIQIDQENKIIEELDLLIEKVKNK